MVVGIIAEKPSAARALATALGGMSGTFNGEQYVIAHARGHLYELKPPHQQVDAAQAEKYSKWDLGNLPWDLSQFSWELEPIKDTGQLRQELQQKLSSCDEICIGTDVDPSGAGGEIAVNAIKELDLHPRKFSRMYFTDEAAVSLQKGFKDRKDIPDLDGFDEYRKSFYRNCWDFASIQFTRAASLSGGEFGTVLRQGRLKSAMVRLVGDQKKAYDDYVKKPFFQNRFKDENGVTYTNPEEPTFDQKSQVPQTYSASAVVEDSRKAMKTAPPKLLDLAGLSSVLSKTGMKPAQVLKIYQALYEAQIVSYPRTEDRTITPEQFQELVPLTDKIAKVVNVDPQILTHRTARSTHVKAQGAHGANRPGPTVPASLAQLDSKFGKGAGLIYQTLAKNFLAILAEDYLYEQQKGHVEKHPDFVGIANVPKSAGWKAVFDADAEDGDDGDENESAKGLGKNAEPFVFEGANKRPEHPSMKWLMKQLEKRDVGTGATRTSTYAEVTNERAKNPLLVDKRGKLTLAKAGEMSWLLLPGTHIGDLALTERVYAEMKQVAEGADSAPLLAGIADWVREDIATMQKNAVAMRDALGLGAQTQSARADGVWQTAPGGPKKVGFKKFFSGHEFTDDEVAKLLAGETIEFPAQSKAGKPYTARGALGLGEFVNKEGKKIKYVGFQLEVSDTPTSWCGHAFTDAEAQALLAGKDVVRDDWVGKSGKPFSVRVTWDAKKKSIVAHFDDVPRSFSGVALSEEQRKKLERGERVVLVGVKSKKSGRTYDAPLLWKEEKKGQGKKLVLDFDKR